MSIRPTTCPACKKVTSVPDDVEVSCCMYCGQSINVKDVVQITVGPNLDNLLGMARTAAAAGNVDEATLYFNRVLELDPTISEAWIGKGRAAGWASSLTNLRFSEMLLAFNHGLATAPGDSKASIVLECVEESNRLVVTLYGMARKHMLEYVALPNVWSEYLVQVSQMLTTLEKIYEWDPSYRVTLENVIHLCKDNRGGLLSRPLSEQHCKGLASCTTI